jgi:kynurenine formamidase
MDRTVGDTMTAERRSRRLIDLSHKVEHGMITYQGLPGPVICDFLTREASRSHYAAGTEFQIGKIEMVANTGTYLDSPFHRYADGKDLARLDLDSLADLDAVVIRCRGRSGGRPCWWTPAGPSTGGPTAISMGIPS